MREKRPVDSIRGTQRRSSRRERQGQLDIEMESALRPREIQTRIRAGESVEDVARAAGVPVGRIDAYAGPVLAEREHIAREAQRGSVRRRGETAGHRVLSTAVAERLATRGVDPQTVDWDSFRMEDGRWSVIAAYASGEANRQAMFFFDPKSRFSVAGNDEARWLLSEQSPTHGPQPGRRSPSSRDSDAGLDADAELTLDLNDELALVRVVQDPKSDISARDTVQQPNGLNDDDVQPGESTTQTSVGIVRLVPPNAPDPTEYTTLKEPGRDQSAEGLDPTTTEDDPSETEDDEPVTELDETSELDLLFDMLGGEGYSEDSGRVYPGLTEARPDRGWEPAVVVNYPAEYPVEPAAEPTDRDVERFASDDTSAEEGDAVARGRVPAADEPEELELRLDQPARAPVESQLPPAPNARTDNDASLEDAAPESRSAPASAAAAGTKSAAAPPEPAAPEPVVDKPAAKKAAPKKRKRAEVPSWDEIMFGGPKRP